MDISETNIAFAVKDRIHAALRGFTSKVSLSTAPALLLPPMPAF